MLIAGKGGQGDVGMMMMMVFELCYFNIWRDGRLCLREAM